MKKLSSEEAATIEAAAKIITDRDGADAAALVRFLTEPCRFWFFCDELACALRYRGLFIGADDLSDIAYQAIRRLNEPTRRPPALKPE